MAVFILADREAVATVAEKEGEYCPNCGLANYEGLCLHCTGEGFPCEQEPEIEEHN